MINTIKKLKEVLTRREMFKLLVLLGVFILMAFFQVLGIASLMPFIALVMEPDMVFENEWLLRAYNLFDFRSVQSFIIATGIVMLLIIIFSNGISALATWLKLRFAWQNNHRLSRLLLEKYLSRPYHFFLNKNSAELSNSVLGEVKHLTSSFMLPLLMLVTSGITITFILALLLWVDVVVSLIAVFLWWRLCSIIPEYKQKTEI